MSIFKKILCMGLLCSLMACATSHKKDDSEKQVDLKKEQVVLNNPLIDAKGFADDTLRALEVRQGRLLSEIDFVRMAQEKDTIILDARRVNRFAQAHVADAINLPFTEFSIASLAKVVPNKHSRILIYCNNNFDTEPKSPQYKNASEYLQAMKVAMFSKSVRSPLNLPTYVSLYSYGYDNIYELGVAINPLQTNMRFEGSLINQ